MGEGTIATGAVITPSYPLPRFLYSTPSFSISALPPPLPPLCTSPTYLFIVLSPFSSSSSFPHTPLLPPHLLISPSYPFFCSLFLSPLLFPSHLHNVPFSSVSLSLSILIVFPFHSPLPITPLPPITSLPSSSYTSLMQTYTLEGHGCTAMGVFPLLAAPTPT